ncbi:hypothetical protein FHL15_002916 [Xylaria flabelliformis]|uniref:Uncharacterized protein n=1 Tax=Xylaria flabelliformis TaxID=2512241 RepID=A0A553I7L4_9PEZI|nr:hypothetical protein FHL15_002916 [Xylaria flabelliformis]
MADRAPTHNLRLGANRQTRTATGTAGVRRNLFQSHLTRRPTPTESSRPGSGIGGTTSAATTTNSSSSNSVDMLRFESDAPCESSEIVIRDKNGEFEVGDPPTPPLNDPGEEPALDDAQENEQVLEVLRASMRAKVAALAEDNWMYEAEEAPRVH